MLSTLKNLCSHVSFFPGCRTETNGETDVSSDGDYLGTVLKSIRWVIIGIAVLAFAIGLFLLISQYFLRRK